MNENDVIRLIEDEELYFPMNINSILGRYKGLVERNYVIDNGELKIGCHISMNDLNQTSTFDISTVITLTLPSEIVGITDFHSESTIKGVD